MSSEPKPKKRVSYDKDMRAHAKAAGAGLITIAITMPNGDHEEYQTPGTAKSCRFAKWAGVALKYEEARGALPDLEEIIRLHVEANQDND